MIPGDCSYRLRVGAHPRACFGVHESDSNGIAMRGQGVSQLISIDGGPPVELDSNDLGADTLANVLHASAEHAIDADDDLVAGLEHVDHAGFHPDRAWRREHERQRVLRLHAIAQALPDLVHNPEKLGVQVPDRWLRQGLQNTVGYVRWPGSE